MLDTIRVYRNQLVFSYVTYKMMRENPDNLVRNMVEFVGVSSKDFPTIRVIQMNNHRFFGRKYKEPNNYMTWVDVHHFLGQVIKKKINPYMKAQEYLPLKHDNIKRENEISNLSAMMRLHSKNFEDEIEKKILKFGLFIYVYAEPEICPKCERYENMVIENFHKVTFQFLDILRVVTNHNSIF